jgi:hypothetical protein
LREPFPVTEGKLNFQYLWIQDCELCLRITCHIVEVFVDRRLNNIPICIANVFTSYIYEPCIILEALANELILDLLRLSKVQRETRIIAWYGIEIVV